MQQTEEFCSIDSEAGILATLVRNPLFYYYAEDLLPNHFFDLDNRYLYTAISDLIRRGIQKIDPYNIIEDLNASEATRGYTENLTVERLNEFFDTADTISRSTVKEYKLLVGNVLAAAFRRDIRQRLKDCMGLCERIDDREKLERKIYDKIDGVMLEYSAHDEIPAYRDMVDECWNEIRARQVDGFSGIPFKFPTLNQYAVIERGELFIFAAEAKQGKSMILLNCAMDLLRQGLSVLYLDSELNTRLFTARVLSHLSAVEFRRLTAGNYTPEEADRIQEAIDWIKTKSFTHVYIGCASVPATSPSLDAPSYLSMKHYPYPTYGEASSDPSSGLTSYVPTVRPAFSYAATTCPEPIWQAHIADKPPEPEISDEQWEVYLESIIPQDALEEWWWRSVDDKLQEDSVGWYFYNGHAHAKPQTAPEELQASPELSAFLDSFRQKGGAADGK